MSGCVDVEPLFREGGVLVTRWHCRVRDAGAAATMCHEWHVMMFVHTGAFQAHLKDGTAYVDSTRTLLTEPRESFQVTRQFGPAVAGSAIGISPRLMQLVLGGREDGPVQPTRLLRAEVTPRALLIQHLILRQIEEGVSRLAIEELGLALAGETFRDPRALPLDERPHRTARRDAVQMAQAILAANYEKQVRLEDIARAVNVSPYHLCRTFKRATGVHMHQYLNRLRLRASLEQVAEPRLSLAEIAHGHGFSSRSHFAQAFRKEFRITPSQVRRLATRNVSEMRHALGLAASELRECRNGKQPPTVPQCAISL